MWFTSRLGISLSVDVPLFIITLLLLSGVGVPLSGVMQFARANTTIHPTSPEKTSTLVTSGIYGYTRNPMYLGLVLLLSAWGCYLGSLLSFLWLPIFIVYINKFQILPEERTLNTLFGVEFDRYCVRVRRWL